MMNYLTTAVLLVACISFTNARKCDKLEIRFNSCLDNGYAAAKIEGCVSGSGELSKRAAKKCGRIEKKLSKCGFACVVEDKWCVNLDSYLGKHASAPNRFSDLESAKSACIASGDCGGITLVGGYDYQLRVGPDVQVGKSPSGETAYNLC